MDPRLALLQSKAFADDHLKAELIATRKEKDPVGAFCAVAEKYGCYISAEELVTLGEESCAAMLRSQNGGGEYNPCGCWDDDYELFFLNLGDGK